MNGRTNEKFVLDSCTCVNFFNKKILSLPENDLFISVITEMEVLAKPDMTPEAEQEIQNFLEEITIPLSGEIKREAIRIRRAGTPRLKLPDAIVAATAVVLDARLVTADDRLFKLAWPGFNAPPRSSSRRL
jgi:predicted nucleic acid-binding protein